MQLARLVTDLRKNLAATIDRVTADHDYTIITREGGKPAAVLMSLEDFASWQETDYLLRSPANAARLVCVGLIVAGILGLKLTSA